MEHWLVTIAYSDTFSVSQHCYCNRGEGLQYEYLNIAVGESNEKCQVNAVSGWDENEMMRSVLLPTPPPAPERRLLRWRYFWIKESVRHPRWRGLTRIAAQQKSARFHGPFYP